MTRGSIGLYRKPNGTEEVRIHFDEWKLPDGSFVQHVTIFPHPCGHCVGGDHTHIEMDDLREPITLLEQDCVVLSFDHHMAISHYLAVKHSIDQLTGELVPYLGIHAMLGH